MDFQGGFSWFSKAASRDFPRRFPCWLWKAVSLLAFGRRFPRWLCKAVSSLAFRRQFLRWQFLC